ncbi:MAG: restriction endonuclease [Dehalococcoidales bacterium]|nr:restriction endonuclease [Dehalococcoidales bacterium]
MAIPDYETIMLPLLKYISDKLEHPLRETIDSLAIHFHLTQEEKRELLPSGHQAIFNNRVGWARTYLKKAGLIESTRRGYFRITERGITCLKSPIEKIDNSYLQKFKEFRDFKAYTRLKSKLNINTVTQEETTDEILENAYQNLRIELVNELLQQIKNNTPTLFENIVVDMLVKMGYGGNRKDAGEAIGKSGDEGIDGIIKEDPLGLDIIYIQAKKWGNVVSRPEIQKFTGALQGKRAKKGIFITTSNYSKSARDFADSIENKIILIDGEQLTQLMIDHNIGVSSSALYETKKIDLDYFVEQ